MKMATTSAVVLALIFTVAISAEAQTDPNAAARFAAAQAALDAKPRAATQPAIKQIAGRTPPNISADPTARPSLKLKSDAPKNVKAFIQECEATHLELLEKCKADVKLSREAINKAIAAHEGKDAILDAKASLKKCEDTLEAVDGESALIAAPPLKMEIGKIGTLRGYYVVQILDGKNMLAHLAVQVVENVGTGSMPRLASSLGPADEIVWFEDFDTSGMTDKSTSVDDKQVFECVGTKQYDTAGGSSSTVRLLRPFDIDRYVDK